MTTNTSVSLVEVWKEFYDKMGLASVPVPQQIDSRRLFYAGAQAMFSLMDRISQDTNEDRAVEKMDELESEIADFVVRIGTDQEHRL